METASGKETRSRHNMTSGGLFLLSPASAFFYSLNIFPAANNHRATRRPYVLFGIFVSWHRGLGNNSMDSFNPGQPFVS
jgi:hypothetical protein